MSVLPTITLSEFPDWCKLNGKKYATVEQLRDAFSEVSEVKLGDSIITMHYPGRLSADTVRSREYIAGFIHRRHYKLIKESFDEDLDFILTDAVTEVDLVKGGGDRKPQLVVEDGDVRIYAFVHFPLDVMFTLREEVANELMSDYIFIQTFDKIHRKRMRVLRWWQCLIKNIHDLSTS